MLCWLVENRMAPPARPHLILLEYAIARPSSLSPGDRLGIRAVTSIAGKVFHPTFGFFLPGLIRVGTSKGSIAVYTPLE